MLPSVHEPIEPLDAQQRLRAELASIGEVPLPGVDTLARWRVLTDLARRDLSSARLTEGHLDALAILHELHRDDLVEPGQTWGVWAAEPARLRAVPIDAVPIEAVPIEDGSGWALQGAKGWCSGSVELDRALVTAVAPDGPRLFAIAPNAARPAELEVEPGSWQPLGMAATVSHTLRFDLAVGPSAVVGEPEVYVDRPGFAHGGAGVAACWFGGAVAVAERLGERVSRDQADPARHGRVVALLDLGRSRLESAAREIDADPTNGAAAIQRAASVRLGIGLVCRQVLSEVTSSLGASALCHDPEHQQRVADLLVYLGQLQEDGTARQLGAGPSTPTEWS